MKLFFQGSSWTELSRLPTKGINPANFCPHSQGATCMGPLDSNLSRPFPVRALCALVMVSEGAALPETLPCCHWGTHVYETRAIISGSQSQWALLYWALSSKNLCLLVSILIHPVWTPAPLDSTETLILVTSQLHIKPEVMGMLGRGEEVSGRGEEGWKCTIRLGGNYILLNSPVFIWAHFYPSRFKSFSSLLSSSYFLGYLIAQLQERNINNQGLRWNLPSPNAICNYSAFGFGEIKW